MFFKRLFLHGTPNTHTHTLDLSHTLRYRPSFLNKTCYMILYDSSSDGTPSKRKTNEPCLSKNQKKKKNQKIRKRKNGLIQSKSGA